MTELEGRRDAGKLQQFRAPDTMGQVLDDWYDSLAAKR